jgi:hypothetical protein
MTHRTKNGSDNSIRVPGLNTTGVLRTLLPLGAAPLLGALSVDGLAVARLPLPIQLVNFIRLGHGREPNRLNEFAPLEKRLAQAVAAVHEGSVVVQDDRNV